MKKLANVIALFILVSVNVLTPISYAQETPEVEEIPPVVISQEKEQGEEEEPIVDEETSESVEDLAAAVEEQPEVVSEDTVPSLIDMVVDMMDDFTEEVEETELFDEGLVMPSRWEITVAEETLVTKSITHDVENGIIKLKYGDDEIWIKDKNVGASETALTENAFKLKQLMDEMCNFPMVDILDLNISNYSDYECDSNFATAASELTNISINTYADWIEFINEHTNNSASYWNYYRWGNDWYAKYDELSCKQTIASEGLNGCELNITEETIQRWFLEFYKDNEWWYEWWYSNPCDATEWEYLPSPSDWGKLVNIRENIKSDTIAPVISDANFVIHGWENGYSLMSDLMVPHAWYISRYDPYVNQSLSDNGTRLYYANNFDYLQTNDRWSLAISSNEYIAVRYSYVDYANPIRCFVATDPVIVTLKLNNGEADKTNKIQRWATLGALDIPTKDGYLFAWWYINSDLTEKYISHPITEDITLYAKWLELRYEEWDITYTDTNGKIFSWIWTITLIDWVNSITMLDRNLGSEWESSGYYFQWWNNYGFLPGENEIDEERVDVTWYWWNNPYVSNIFIVNTWQRNYSELSNNNEEESADGLWWWFWDYRDNTWDSSEGHDYMRQWPCPEWYHVPSGWELIELISLWSEANNAYVSPNDKLAINISSHTEYYDFLEDFNIPRIWRIDYKVNLQPIDWGGALTSINENLKLKNFNKFAYVWSSSPYYLTADGGYELYWESRRLSVWPNAKSHGSIERSNWFPVRCFKDNYEEWDEPLVLSYDTRWGTAIQAQTLPEWGKWYLPWYTTYRTGYELLWWYYDFWEIEFEENGNTFKNLSIDEDLANDEIVTVYARWSDDHVVTFKDYDGRVIKVVLVRDWETAIAPANPSRDWYKFTWWSKDLTNVTEDLEVMAQYSANGGWYSGWGGSSSRPSSQWSWPSSSDVKSVDNPKDNTTDNKKEETKPEVKPVNNGGWKTVSTGKVDPQQELFDAYKWAYANGLTKYVNMADARLDDPLNRQEMAKISTLFATKFVDKSPNIKKRTSCSQYSDLWKVTSDMEEFIIESCELGYMWYRANGVDYLERFRPYTPVSLAEFSIILSRIMWWNRYAISEKQWYQWHLHAVYENNLIDNITKPFENITRKDAYLMLYRLSKNF